MDASDLHSDEVDERKEAAQSPIGLLSGAAAPLWGAVLHAERLRREQRDGPVRGYLAGVADGGFARLGATALRAQAGLAAAGIEFEPLANAEVAAAAHGGAQRSGAAPFSVLYSSASGMLRGGAPALARARRIGAVNGGVAVIADSAQDVPGAAVSVLRDLEIPTLHPATPIEAVAACLAGLEAARSAQGWVGVALSRNLTEATSHHPEASAALERLGAGFYPDDGRSHGSAGARFGFLAAGEGWATLTRALEILQFDAAALERLSLTIYRAASTHPLDAAGLNVFASGLKRLAIVEPAGAAGALADSAMAALFGRGDAPEIVRKPLETGDFAAEALAVDIARRLSEVDPDFAERADRLAAQRSAVVEAQTSPAPAANGADIAEWIGAARYSNDERRLIRLESPALEQGGFAAIQATARAGAPATFLIRWRDAAPELHVQSYNDDALEVIDATDPSSPSAIAARLLALGVDEVALVCDPARPLDRRALPAAAKVARSTDLNALEAEMARADGVAVILDLRAYDGVESLRRIGLAAEASVAAINPALCDACGHCGSGDDSAHIRTIFTEHGEGRRIDATKAGIDPARAIGSCPAFLGATGARRRPMTRIAATLPPAAPTMTARRSPWVIGFAGGEPALGAARILAAAARRDGRAAGLWHPIAQNGDLAAICRIGSQGDDGAHRDSPSLSAPPALGEIDQLLVCADEASVNDALLRAPSATAGPIAPESLSAAAFGDEAAAGHIALGAACQNGLLPVDLNALEDALSAESGAEQDRARDGFELGRAAAANPATLPISAAQIDAEPLPVVELIDANAAVLTDYQDANWAARYRAVITGLQGAEQAISPGSRELTRAAAEGLFALMRYRDVYETARLLARTTDSAAFDAFAPSGDSPVRPILYIPSAWLAGREVDGTPRKIGVGGWIMPALRLLARGKAIRGGAFDPLGWTAVRQLERGLIDQFEREAVELARGLSPKRLSIAAEIARLPLQIRGFGLVKERAAAEAAAKRAELWAAYRAAPGL